MSSHDEKRLLILADALDSWQEQDAGLRFNLAGWSRPILSKGQKCGTVCCAVGYAAEFVPELMVQGLSMAGPAHDRQPQYLDYVGWSAVLKFFGLSDPWHMRLFNEGDYEPGVTPRDVASRIRQFITGETK